MRILAHRPSAWFLAEDDGGLLLDVNCSNGPAGYSVPARLTPEERADHAARANAALDALADRIQDAGPPAFAQRDVGPATGERFRACVMARLAAQRAADDPGAG
jgi:hypothetical protein